MASYPKSTRSEISGVAVTGPPEVDEAGLSCDWLASAEGVIGGVGKGGVGTPGANVGVGRRLTAVGAMEGTESSLADSVAQPAANKPATMTITKLVM